MRVIFPEKLSDFEKSEAPEDGAAGLDAQAIQTETIANPVWTVLIDRVRQGSVTDFVKLPLGWPPFNLADVSITVGILLLFVLAERARAGQG